MKAIYDLLNRHALAIQLSMVPLAIVLFVCSGGLAATACLLGFCLMPFVPREDVPSPTGEGVKGQTLVEYSSFRQPGKVRIANPKEPKKALKLHEASVPAEAKESDKKNEQQPQPQQDPRPRTAGKKKRRRKSKKTVVTS